MNGNNAESLKLRELKSKRTPFQQQLLDDFWGYFRSKGEWPLARSLYSKFGRTEVRQALSALGGNVVREETDQRGKGRMQLSLLGILLTKEGPKAEDLLKRYLEFQRSIFEREPEKDQITHEEVGNALKLSPEETALLGQLIFFGSMYGSSGGRGQGNWTVSSMSEVEEFSKSEDLSEQVAVWAMRHHRADAAVFKDEIRQQQLSLPSYASLDQLLPHQLVLQPSPIHRPTRDESLSPNPLKRRYQVFVSSTYNDLIEERKYVIQALLVTKCIPSGMELFPAANMDQWKLIKQVIDDCDYYIVIVGGKYGSFGTGGVSFTEMEFDYAASIGKPILGFFHADITKLTGDKLEDTDERRQKLRAFTEKVKQRLCHKWSSPDGLESAIKTAIMHAIETDPKSGWVRASSVPSWGMVENLEERISELEDNSKK